MEISRKNLILTVLSFYLVLSSCQKEELQENQYDLLLAEQNCADLSCLLSQVTEHEYSEAYDGMIFHAGYALQELANQHNELKYSLLNSYNVSLASLLKKHPAIKTEFNERVKHSLIRHDVYESLYKLLPEDALEEGNFDFVAYFDEILLKEQEEQLVLYSLPHINRRKKSANVAIGFDITVPHNKGLVFSNHSPLILTENQAISMTTPEVVY